VPANLDRFKQKLMEWFPEDRFAIFETMTEIKLIGKALHDGNFQKNPNILKRVIELNSISFADYLDGRFQHPHTSNVLSSMNLYAGTHLKELPAIFMFNLLMSYHEGAFYPKGGSQQLTHVLRDYLHSVDCQVLVRRRVEKIITDGKKVLGVVDHKGNQYHSSIVISNADMRKTMQELLDDHNLPLQYNQSIQKLIPSHSAIILYAVLKNEGVTLTLPHELFLFPEKLLINDHDYLYQPLDMQTDPGISICCPSVVDKSLAPQGYSIMTAMVFCDHNSIEKLKKEQGKSVIEDGFLRLLESKLPGIQEQIILSELATPNTVERFTLSSQGALYGWKKSLQQPWLAKMGPNTPIQGLYMSGQWTPQFHGVYGTCVSGRKTAETILNDILTNNPVL
jgi:phytoene dehydrogenase-like protein